MSKITVELYEEEIRHLAWWQAQNIYSQKSLNSSLEDISLFRAKRVVELFNCIPKEKG